MPRVDAIDISHHNTITRFDRIPSVRLMAHKATEGRGFVDPRVRQRWPSLRERHELMCGYHWVRPDSSMQEQAEHHARVMEELGWERGVFTQLDWERTHSGDTELRPMQVEEIEEWCDHHARLLGKGRLLVYVNPNVDTSYGDWRKNNPDVPHWLPNYSSTGPAKARELRATIHQWTAAFVHDGFTSGIDANEVLDWAAVERAADVATSDGSVGRPSLDPVVPPNEGPLGFMRELALDDEGNAVYVLQTLLIEHGTISDRDVNRDGRFETGTHGAVKRFQAERGLDATGRVDRRTWQALASARS